jgi:predicted RNA-binding Zn ribbon-like protein
VVTADVTRTIVIARHPAAQLPLLGNRLCLDFANTLVWRLRDQPSEFLDDYPALVAWSRHAGTLDDELAARLLDEARGRTRVAAASVERAVALREAIYGIFVAITEGAAPARADLAGLNEVLDAGMGRAKLFPTADGFIWGWGGEPELERPLWPVARSAAELLISDDLARVRRCPGEGCGWLFLDTTRNGSRRWCETAGCGNRARVRAHYRRKTAGRSS